MDSPVSVVAGVINEERFKFEAGVLSHVIGTLIAWALGLLVWLMYRLWQDYISTILMAFIVSQTLHSQRARLVATLQWLRSPSSPSIVGWLVASARPRELLHSLRAMPALMQLSTLLGLFLMSEDIFTWISFSIFLVGPTLLALVMLVLVDKSVLKFNALVSDETLCATVVLSTLLFTVAFVTVDLAVYSAIDLVTLLLSASAWVHEVSADAASDSMRSLATQGYELGMQGLEHLRRADHAWVPVVSHAIEQIGSSNNRTVVVESTFHKLRECYPTAAWTSQAEDLGKLALFAATRAAGASSAANATSANATAGSLSWLSLDVKTLVDGARSLGRELANELDNPGELVAMVRAHVAEAWPVLPEKVAPLLFGGAAGALARLLQAVHLSLALGATTIVFLTMTFYMLASEQDVLTVLVNKVHPQATTETLRRMRDTIDAAIIMPVSGASRNAMLSLLSYKLLGLPCKHLAAFGVMVFSLFPLAYAWVVCLPWVACLLLGGQWFRGVLLLSIHVATLSGHSETELELQSQTGIGDYVHAFSLVLGVYVFGLQGVLFGPMIVCAAKLVTDLVSEVVKGLEQRTSETPDAAAAAAAGDANGGHMARTAAADGAGALAPAANAAAPAPRTTSGAAVPVPSAVKKNTSNSALGSQTLGHVIGTMRRLSFFSSPGATPKHRVPSSSDFPRAPNDPARPLASPAFPDRVRISVSVGGTPVRVTVPYALTSWEAVLTHVTNRLHKGDAMRAGEEVSGLYGSDGSRVVSIQDLRDGETLTARTTSSERRGSTFSHMTLDDVDLDSEPMEVADAPVAALFMSPQPQSDSLHERKRHGAPGTGQSTNGGSREQLLNDM